MGDASTLELGFVAFVSLALGTFLIYGSWARRRIHELMAERDSWRTRYLMAMDELEGSDVRLIKPNDEDFYRGFTDPDGS